MKKYVAILLALVTAVSLAACGGKPEEKPTDAVEDTTELPEDPNKVAMAPLTAPIYTFDHEPTPEELRATVVKAMQDELSLQWYTPENFQYNKTGAASGKDYVFTAGQHYAGLPYCNAQRSIFGMLEYVDANGKLDVDKVREDSGMGTLGAAVNYTIGNTCAGSTSWALFSCCNSIDGPCIAYNQCVSHGYYPVGNYTYDFTIDTFQNYPTPRICSENGTDVMYDSYSKALPGDLMIITPDGDGEHSTMVIENHVVMAGDKVNPTESYIIVQDQNTGFYEDKNENGRVLQYVGRTGINAWKKSYEEWFKASYIPVTVKELTGEKAYEKATVECSGLTTSADLKSAKLTSNYPMAVVKLMAPVNGKLTDVYHQIMSREDIKTKTAMNLKLSKLTLALNKAGVEDGAACKILVTVSTGEEFTFEFNK